MGITTALTAAGLSATTAASVATGVYAAAASSLTGALASKAMKPRGAQSAAGVQPLTQADKPQEAKPVDLNQIRKKNAMAAAASGSLGGNNSTLLTGSQGIGSGSLNLGQSTLLGQ